MKKTVLGILILFLGATTFAQSGADALKSAAKAMTKYNSDPAANMASLDEAKTLLQTAFEDESISSNAKSWITRADIFAGLVKAQTEAQTKAQLMGTEFTLSEKMAALDAANAFLKAYDLASAMDAKSAKKINKSVMSGLKEVEGDLNNYGVTLYQDADYAGALQNFETELKIYEILKSKGENSRIDDEEMRNEKIYFTGITAKLGENYEAAIPYLTQLVEGGTDESVIYQFLYESYDALGNEEKSLETLQAGRAKFPDDANMLFAEINYFLKKGELEKMIGNLESALAREPDNVSVITTLGQVYDQLSVGSEADGNTELSKEYYSKAESYYGDALNQNPDNFDLNYSMGALHYNRAATLTDDLNALADDFSAAGAKKYDVIKNTMAGFFDKALPYFLKADGINGTDRNTLIALKEIFARKDDFAKSNEYKEKLDALGQ